MLSEAARKRVARPRTRGAGDKEINPLARFRFALHGLAHAWRTETSFRIQLAAAGAAIAVTAWVQPPLVWAALVAAMIALVLAAELFNTALERLLDGLHPQHARFVQAAKDCAAAAVLMLSIASVAVFVLMLAASSR